MGFTIIGWDYYLASQRQYYYYIIQYNQICCNKAARDKYLKRRIVLIFNPKQSNILIKTSLLYMIFF